MRFDGDSQALVLDDDFVLPARWYVSEGNSYEFQGEQLRIEHRRMRADFENRWGISLIWGSLTYSDNYHHPHGWNRHLGEVRPDFVEDPSMVEAAVILPETHTKPATTLPGLGGMKEVTLPEREVFIWGDVMGYLTSDALKCLILTVSRFDSHEWAIPTSGPEIDQDENGNWAMIVSFEPVEEHCE